MLTSSSLSLYYLTFYCIFYIEELNQQLQLAQREIYSILECNWITELPCESSIFELTLCMGCLLIDRVLLSALLNADNQLKSTITTRQKKTKNTFTYIIILYILNILSLNVACLTTIVYQNRYCLFQEEVLLPVFNNIYCNCVLSCKVQTC